MNYTIPLPGDLQLTEFQPGDQANLVRYLNDPELYRNTLSIPSPYTQRDADERLEKLVAQKEQYDLPTDWALRHPVDGVIGGIGIFLKKGFEGHLDELGYWLAAPYRGQGLMTMVIRTFTDWQFEQRPALQRMEALVFAHNPASVRVLEKCGFEREGYLRQYVWKNGAAIDAILLARIRQI